MLSSPSVLLAGALDMIFRHGKWAYMAPLRSVRVNEEYFEFTDYEMKSFLHMFNSTWIKYVLYINNVVSLYV